MVGGFIWHHNNPESPWLINSRVLKANFTLDRTQSQCCRWWWWGKSHYYCIFMLKRRSSNRNPDFRFPRTQSSLPGIFLSLIKDQHSEMELVHHSRGWTIHGRGGEEATTTTAGGDKLHDDCKTSELYLHLGISSFLSSSSSPTRVNFINHRSRNDSAIQWIFINAIKLIPRHHHHHETRR